MRSLLVSPRASDRLAHLRRALGELAPDEEVVVIGPSLAAVDTLLRTALSTAASGASFGWHRLTLNMLAARLASVPLAEAERVPASTLSLEATCARVVHHLAETEQLGRYGEVGRRPGFARALAATHQELALAGLGPQQLRGSLADLARIDQALREELAQLKLAPRAEVLGAATRAASQQPHPLVGLKLLLFDVPVRNLQEERLLASVVARAPQALAVSPAGDEGSNRRLARALGTAAEALPAPQTESALSRLQWQLFSTGDALSGTSEDSVQLLSAPGESRECVEIARQILRAAAEGCAFDRMAILLRSHDKYTAHLQEALRRAQIPAYFTGGTLAPDPSGRALLALLECARENLSARRFAEYLSLGVVPDVTDEGSPPEAPAQEDRWAPPGEEQLAFLGADPGEPPAPESEEELFARAADTHPVNAGTLRAPRRWERLLVDAAVVGSRERWRRRLEGLERELAAGLEELEADSPRRLGLERQIAQLAELRRFSLPIVSLLDELRGEASWARWLERLSVLATRALREPARVLEVLSELTPLGPVGPVSLAEVQLVLARRLRELRARPTGSAVGKVFVGSTDEARGLERELVFVPGLAEKLFPHKVSEDPLLLDAHRRSLSDELERNEERVRLERLALHLAVGAATRRVVLSYPRVDVERGRPRVPSFYSLEVLRAAEGKLPGFDELTRRALPGAAERLGWPAPARAEDAIDNTEYDLAVLDDLVSHEAQTSAGAAHYLLGSNSHLARSLRFRGRRWEVRKLTYADGLVDPSPSALTALERHDIGARAFSATALESYSQCPYKFFLKTVIRLAPREEALSLDELDPLSRGRLIHEIQRRFLTELKRAELIPLDPEQRGTLVERLDATTKAASQELAEELAPALQRVWDTQVALIGADLRRWLDGLLEDRSWTPESFELSFGLPLDADHDSASLRDPVKLDTGLQLRGSMDLVERNSRGVVRVTDNKTGRAPEARSIVIDGGRVLQPVLYAMALERLRPGDVVAGGRLYFCTSRGSFRELVVELDERARSAVKHLSEVLEMSLKDGFFPAAPAKGACRWCDYQAVCGPYEELRMSLKRPQRLEPLAQLRRLP